jgi:hypothetical protein
MTPVKEDVELSLSIGKSRAFLSVYKFKRGIKNSFDALKDIEKRQQNQDRIINILSDIYFELKDTKGTSINAFGVYLFENKVTGSVHTLDRILGRTFRTKTNLLSDEQIEKYENIIKLYGDWYAVQNLPKRVY